MKRKMKVAIVMIYLQNNLGDDLFLQHICLKYPNVDFYVAENNLKNETFEGLRNLHFSRKMKSFAKEYEMPQVSKKVKRYFKKFDACLILGGSLFMQHSQNWDLKLRSFQNRVNLNKNTYVVGANFGPFEDVNFLTEFETAFAQVSDLCFRDTVSAAYFPDAENIRHASDILFDYKYEMPEQKNHIAISVLNPEFRGRPVKQFEKISGITEKYKTKLVEICSECQNRGVNVSLVPFCEAQLDLKMAKQIESECLQNGITNVEICEYNGDVKPVLDTLASSRGVIATRFHAMILGFVFQKAVYPIIYDAKQKYVLQDMNFFGDGCPIEKIASVNAKEIVDCLLDSKSKNSYEKNKKIIDKAVKDSKNQFAGLDKLLNGGAK